GSLYEGGVRVPLIVRWPGKIKAGSSSDFVTGFEDWIPTLLELTGHKGEEDEELDGISIAPTLMGKKQPRREFLYREFSGYGGQQALWLGKWKGIRQRLLRDKKKPVKEKLRIQLYDLEKDPSESEDVASKNPEVVDRIRELLEQEHTPSKFFPIKPID
ncbi:MAG: sulfatase/phosphatase domain-containing protein, partial [Planctomycetota bacterium]|nr:sulfatase/phosphatase domain-containing protein [Planctomycetota bacterium]